MNVNKVAPKPATAKAAQPAPPTDATLASQLQSLAPLLSTELASLGQNANGAGGMTLASLLSPTAGNADPFGLGGGSFGNSNPFVSQSAFSALDPFGTLGALSSAGNFGAAIANLGNASPTAAAAGGIAAAQPGQNANVAASTNFLANLTGAGTNAAAATSPVDPTLAAQLNPFSQMISGNSLSNPNPLGATNPFDSTSQSDPFAVDLTIAPQANVLGSVGDEGGE